MAKKATRGGKREGAGRKVASPDGPTVFVGASVPQGLAEQLEAYAQEHGLSRSAVVTKAIGGLLGKRKQVAKG